jgi:hypothetical protein
MAVEKTPSPGSCRAEYRGQVQRDAAQVDQRSYADRMVGSYPCELLGDPGDLIADAPSLHAIRVKCRQ